VSDYFLTTALQFFSYIMGEQVNFKCNDDEVLIVQDQHPLLDFYSSSSLKQRFVDRHIATLGHALP
jgi:predicted alpha/beta hydrolase